MRLIDAVETIKAIEECKKIMNEVIINNDRKDLINFVNGLNQACLCIEQQPTIERPKGKWKRGLGSKYHFCTQCNNCALLNDKSEEIFSSFCPNCGAEMEE